MSLALTRDGWPSVAARLEQPPAMRQAVEIDAAGASAWAKANKVSTGGPGTVIGRINAARAAMSLPPFKILPTRVPEQARAKAEERYAPRETSVQDAATAPAMSAASRVSCASAPGLPTTEAELIDLVSDYDGTITGEVTPVLAGWILNLNTGNRPLADAAVDRFVAILKSGQWVNTGEPVILSREAVLNDGQHRLTAIVRSGISAVLDIRFGIERAAFAATGTGTRRTAGNVLAIAGKPNASLQAAIARLLIHHAAGQPQRFNQQVEGRAIIDQVEAEPAIGEVAAVISKLKFAPAKTASFGFVLVLARRLRSAEDVYAFARLVASGVTDEDSPARRLHVRLRDAAMSRERLSQIDVAILAIRAWNAFAVGRAIQQLRVGEVDRTAHGFPKVTA